MLLGLLVLLSLGAALTFLLLRDGRNQPTPNGQGNRFGPPELDPSFLNVQVRYSLERLEQELEVAVPESLGDPSKRQVDSNNPRLTYAVGAERDELRLEARDDRLYISTVVRYQGQAWLETPFGGEITASCGTQGSSDARPRARVSLSTPISVDPEWRIRSNVRVVALEPATEEARDRCRVSFPLLSLDVTELALGAVREQLVAHSAGLDSLLASLDVRSRMDEPWLQLQEPAPLATNVWLVLDPLSVRAGPVESEGLSGDALEFGLSLLARPRVVLGERPTLTASTPLSLEEGTVDRGFTAHVETRLDYPAASQLLEENLGGLEIRIAGRTLRITDVLVLDAGEGRLALELGVAGAVRGRLLIEGRPVLDEAGSEITVSDLRFSADTRNVLVRGAVWLAAPVFARRVRRYARWPLRGELARTRTMALESLNRPLAPGVRLAAEIVRLDLRGVYAAPEALFIQTSLEGLATVEIGTE